MKSVVFPLREAFIACYDLAGPLRTTRFPASDINKTPGSKTPGGLKPGNPCATFLVQNGPKSN